MTRVQLAVALLASAAAAALAAPVVETEAPSPVTTVSREEIEKLPSSRSIEDLLRTCPAKTIPTVTGPPRTAAGGKGAAPPDINCVQPADLNVIEIYEAHNQARYEVGSRPLVWDPVLAAQAASYGPQLSLYGRPLHSSRAGRETSRENLLQALPGTSPQAMVKVWTDERRNFVNGVFPDVSRTGNWADVGHYSQMVWPSTTNLGCAIHRGGQFDWLICRYSPPGNKDGKMVLAERDKEAPLPPPVTGGLIHPTPIAQPRSSYDALYSFPDHKSVKADFDGSLKARSARSLPSLCSPAYMAAYDIRIPWQADSLPAGDEGVGPYLIYGDERGSGRDAFGPRLYTFGIDLADPKLPTVADGAGELHVAPPESILDDLGESCMGPPPESILDDVE